MNNDGMTMTMPVAPTGMMGGYGGGGFGWGNDWWIIILFLLWGNNGWGNNGWGNGGMNGGVGSEVQRGFDHSSVVTKLDGITQGICDSTYALNSTITNGFHGVDSAICNLGYQTQAGFNSLSTQLASCCCDTQRSIDAVRYDMAMQTCETHHAITDSTRQILDFLTGEKLATLTAENQALKTQNYIAANQEAQTAELIRRLGADCPQPAYVVQPPQPVTFATNGCGTAYGNYGNCGCGF